MVTRALLAYPIPRRHLRCCHCQTPFGSDVVYHTLLTLPSGVSEGHRSDFCERCGADRSADGQAGATIFWQGKIPAKVTEEHSTATVLQAVALLRELSACTNDGDAEQAFLLALYLARQRQLALRYQEVAADGSALLWYEVLAAGDLIAVPRVAPGGIAATGLQRQLAERLKAS